MKNKAVMTKGTLVTIMSINRGADMMFFKQIMIFFILLLLTVAISEISAVETIKGDLTLKQLISIAYQSNPGLKAAKKKWAAIIERYPQVTAYDDPVFTYSRFIENVETRVGPQNQKFTISQKIPFPGKLSLKGDIVTSEVQIARIEFEKQTRNLITELKDAYYELAYLYKAEEITRQNKALAEHLAKLGTTDYPVDGTSLNDVFKAQSQLAQLSYDLILLTELKQTEVTHINSILNRDPEAVLGKPDDISYAPFTYPLDELYKLGINNQQELVISALKIKKREKELNLSKMEYLPNFTVGFSYIDVGEQTSMATRPSDSGKDAYTFNLGITIPLWFTKNRSKVARSKNRYEAAFHKKKDLENKAFAHIKMIYFKLQNSERLIKLYRDSLIPQAEQSMETAETWYKEKKGSFSGLLEVRSTWLNFNLALHRALSDYYKRIAQLEKLVGVSLTEVSSRGSVPVGNRQRDKSQRTGNGGTNK